MSETGKNIVLGFQELRKFCRQLSLLLRTADGLMAEAGWNPIPRSSVFGNASRAVEYPDWWLPGDFSRFYKHGAHKHLLAYVGAIVNDHPTDPGGVVVSEPLLSAGWLDYGLGNESNAWENYFCRAHVWWKDQIVYGKLHTSEHPQAIGLPPYVLKVASLAYPLDDIQTAAALKEKVVTQLLDEINKAH